MENKVEIIFITLNFLTLNYFKTVILEFCVEQRSKISSIPNSQQPQLFYQFNLACKLKEILDIFLHFVSENSSMTAANKTFAILSETKKAK